MTISKIESGFPATKAETLVTLMAALELELWPYRVDAENWDAFLNNSLVG